MYKDRFSEAMKRRKKIDLGDAIVIFHPNETFVRARALNFLNQRIYEVEEAIVDAIGDPLDSIWFAVNDIAPPTETSKVLIDYWGRIDNE